MMVHLCILTSLQHISGWEKDCVTAVFNEELLSQLTTTLSGVDSWLILPNRTRAVHGNSTRGFAAQNFSIRPPDRDQPPPLDAERRRRRRRRSQQTRSLHGIALQMTRSHRNRTQFPRHDARSIATLPTAPWEFRQMREREPRLAAPSIRPVLPTKAAYPHDERLRTAAQRPKSASSTYIGRGIILRNSDWSTLPDAVAARASTRMPRQHPLRTSRPGAAPHAARRREAAACSAPHSARKKVFTVEKYFSQQNISGLPRGKKKLKENERHIPAVTSNVTFENESSLELPPATARRQRHTRAIAAANSYQPPHTTNGTYSVFARETRIPARGLSTSAGSDQHIPECVSNQHNGWHTRDASCTGRPSWPQLHARVLRTLCALQRFNPRQISDDAQKDPDTRAIMSPDAGPVVAIAGSVRAANGSHEMGALAQMEKAIAEAPAMLAAKDPASAERVLAAALQAMKDAGGGEASHSRAEEIIAQAQQALRRQLLHGSPHAGKP